MDLIVGRKEVIENIYTLYNYLIGEDKENREYGKNLLKRGFVFVAENIGGSIVFAPSKFVGYQNNSTINHIREEGDGRETNQVLSKIYGREREDKLILEQFKSFLQKFSIERKFDTDKKIRFYFLQDEILRVPSAFFISPTHISGKKEEAWKGFLNKGIAAIGWYHNNYTGLNWSDVEKDIKSHGYESERQALSAYSNLFQIKSGDIIACTNNSHGLFGVGIAISGYKFQEQIHDCITDDRNEWYSHYVEVVWLITTFTKVGNIKRDLSESLWEPYGAITCKTPSPNYLNQLLIGSSKMEPNLELENNNYLKNPLNQILYGPPGTGKTYNTINKALKIIGLNIEGKERTEIKNLFDTKISEGQIVFTTFHQSMSYEDFIEGIKPLKPKEGDSFLKYDVQPGIFKKLCLSAELASTGIEVPKQEKLYNEFIASISSQIEENKTVILTSRSNTEVIIHSVSSGDSLYASPAVTETDNYRNYLVSKDKLLTLDAHFDEISQIQNVVEDIRNVIKGVGHTYYWAVLNAFKKFKKEKLADGEIKKKGNEPISKYVLIIDEINRGNISQIFGELITLIEDDKRQNGTESLEITLPYSQEKFSVPSNLYIIGTMNTADRSVEALDTAIRRRFSFIEMPPKPELLSPLETLRRFWIKTDGEYFGSKEAYDEYEKDIRYLLDLEVIDNNKYVEYGDDIENSFSQEEFELNLKEIITFNGINLEVLLSTINSRIEKLLNKDHQIGHAYFMNVFSLSDLRFTFFNKIIPLLQEYFYGDYAKIGLVLGNGFVKKDKEKVFFAEFDKEYEGDFSDRIVWKIKKDSDFKTDDEFKEAIKSILK